VSSHVVSVIQRNAFEVEMYSEMSADGEGPQMLVPNVPNKIYFQVKSFDPKIPDLVPEPIEFSKAELVMLSKDGLLIPMLDDIKHGHNGRSSFTFTPIFVDGLQQEYYLRIYRAFPGQEVDKFVKQFKVFPINPDLTTIMTLSDDENSYQQKGVYESGTEKDVVVKVDTNDNFEHEGREISL